MDPLVSVIIPVYNQEKYLHETIESVISQTFQDYEFIIIDDGSHDKSAQIIDSYARRDTRIVPVYQSNSGKPNALNAGASKAKGKYIAFMDHDDLMLPERLERQINFLSANPEIDAVSCQCYYIDHKGIVQGLQRYPLIKTVEECRALVINRGIFSGAFTGLMLKKAPFLKVGGLKNEFWPTDDHEFFNRFIDFNYILVIMEDVLVKYRIHDSSTSIKRQTHMFEMIHYTNFCINLRRDNKSYISFKEFLDEKKRISWWKWLLILKEDYAQLYHRTAGRAFYSKKYINFLGLFTLATILSPKFVYHTIFNKIKVK